MLSLRAIAAADTESKIGNRNIEVSRISMDKTKGKTNNEHCAFTIRHCLFVPTNQNIMMKGTNILKSTYVVCF